MAKKALKLDRYVAFRHANYKMALLTIKVYTEQGNFHWRKSLVFFHHLSMECDQRKRSDNIIWSICALQDEIPFGLAWCPLNAGEFCLIHYSLEYQFQSVFRIWRVYKTSFLKLFWLWKETQNFKVNCSFCSVSN